MRDLKQAQELMDRMLAADAPWAGCNQAIMVLTHVCGGNAYPLMQSKGRMAESCICNGSCELLVS